MKLQVGLQVGMQRGLAERSRKVLQIELREAGKLDDCIAGHGQQEGGLRRIAAMWETCGGAGHPVLGSTKVEEPISWKGQGLKGWMPQGVCGWVRLQNFVRQG